MAMALSPLVVGAGLLAFAPRATAFTPVPATAFERPATGRGRFASTRAPGHLLAQKPANLRYGPFALALDDTADDPWRSADVRNFARTAPRAASAPTRALVGPAPA